MSKNAKSVLKAIRNAVIVFVVLNIIYLGIEIFQVGLTPNWNLGFDSGAFSFNGNFVGNKLGEAKGNSILAFVFFGTLLFEYRNGNVSLKEK